jgi:hypothetical protein
VDWSSWWRAELASGDLGALVATPAHAAVLAPQLAEVLGFLPAGSELLADLAEAVTGSATGLDGGPLAALVLRALAWHAGQDRPSGPAGPAGGADAEALWAGSGVVVDELASTVLTLGLPAARSGATGAALAAWGAAGQPVVLTFRQLRLDPPSWRPAPPGAAVRRCTTSAQLLALADAARTGGEVVPAVVVGAPPSVAARAVLRGLQDAGWLLAPAADAAGAPPPAAVRHAGAK